MSSHSSAEYTRRWRREHPERVQAWRKKDRASRDPVAERERKRRSWHRNKASYQPKKTRSERDEIKTTAARQAKDALKKGVLVTPPRCEECGAKVVRLHKHHADYTKPLVVEFLCVDCHAARHRKDVVKP